MMKRDIQLAFSGALVCIKARSKLARLCLLTSLFGLSIPTALAQPLAANKSPTEVLRLESQRFHYQAAKQAREQGDSQKFNEHYRHLDDYPLKQYLDYNVIRTNMRNSTVEELNAFMELYPETFLAMRLRYNAMVYFADRKQWRNFLSFYQPEYNSTKMRCLNIYALAQTGDKSRIAETADIWNQGRSQPKECDPLISLWKKSGGLTDELKWSRFNKAMQNRRRGLANYIARSMTGEQAKLAKLYKDVDRRPHLITKTQSFQKQSLEYQHIIAYGIQRLARKAPKTALKNWEVYEAQQLFPEELQLQTKQTIIRQLTRNGHGEEAQRLLSYSHSLREHRVVEEILRDGLEQLDWDRVLSGIELLDQEKQNSDRWQYWKARATEQLALDQAEGNDDALAKVKATYESLASQRSFYGFLSADRLDKAYSLEDSSAYVPNQKLQQLAENPGLRRAYELWLMGNVNEARAEWLYTSRKLNSEELLIAGELAKNWGWHNGGIQAMIKGNYWDNLSVRFPLAHKNDIQKYAKDNSLDPTLIFAIARQESAFDSQARSSAGAMGLMQLMPATALQTAKRNGIRHRKKDLYKPEHNIRLGSNYLSELITKYNGNRILATAAYNAGPHRVNRWLNNQAKELELPFDAWIETIPFRETRAYVQNVLAYTVIYGYRLGESRNMITAEEAKRPL